jgi:hypothetical protein
MFHWNVATLSSIGGKGVFIRLVVVFYLYILFTILKVGITGIIQPNYGSNLPRVFRGILNYYGNFHSTDSDHPLACSMCILSGP